MSGFFPPDRVRRLDLPRPWADPRARALFEEITGSSAPVSTPAPVAGVETWRFGPVELEVHDEIGFATVDDGVANYQNMDLAGPIRAMTERFLREDLRAMVVFGRTDRFLSGSDPRLMDAMPERNRSGVYHCVEMMGGVASLPVPLVVCLDGDVVGSGAILPSIADVVVATPGPLRITFDDPDVSDRYPPFAAHRVELANALWAPFGADPVGWTTSGDAADAGFVDLVVDREDLRAAGLSEAKALVASGMVFPTPGRQGLRGALDAMLERARNEGEPPANPMA